MNAATADKARARSRMRTPHGAPLESVGTFYERTSGSGIRHIVGFVGGDKWLLFPAKGGKPGEWDCFKQPLRQPSLDTTPKPPPAPLLPDPPREFVSGLPDEMPRPSWRDQWRR